MILLIRKLAGHIIYVPPFPLQVMVNIIQPNYILIFPLIEKQPNGEKEVGLYHWTAEFQIASLHFSQN